MKPLQFWQWIDDSLPERSDWINQLEAIAQASGDCPLEDIIVFDDWLKACIKKTYEKLNNAVIDDFYDINGDIDSFECFVILLGSKTYQQIMDDVSVLNNGDYLKEYESVSDVINNFVDTPDYIFYWRTGKQMKDYRDNLEALKTLQKEVNKSPDKRYH